MSQNIRSRVHLVLRHDQVLGRNEQLINTSVTQIDLHDFSRLATTFGLGGFHCITPLKKQHEITKDILNYWQQGFGQTYNPDRNQALQRLNVHESYLDCLEDLKALGIGDPIQIATSAKLFPDKNLEFSDFLRKMEGLCRPIVIQFGTGWGLTADQCGQSDWILSPIKGYDGYNHLSVRCAAAIIVDRIFGASHN